MTSIEEAWGSSAPGLSQQGKMVGQMYMSGQNRNIDPAFSMPNVNGHGQGDFKPDHHRPPSPHPPPIHHSPGPHYPPPEYQPNISVNIEKSEEERQLFQYLRSRLNEMDIKMMKTYFKNKCSQKVKRASGKCGCVGVSEHMDVCKNCKSMCNNKNEFRANLTMYLLIAVVVLLALNLFFPGGLFSKK